MSLCVNGRFYADDCRCFAFWTGRACDKRLCAKGAGALQPADGLCRCRPGFGGEFCEFEVCRHNDRWYCNTTEMAPPTVWDDETTKLKLHARAPEPCKLDTLNKWFKEPSNITAGWYCNCGTGLRRMTHDKINEDCICPSGYYGEFCEYNLCEQNQTLWNDTAFACEIPRKSSDGVYGFFGVEINLELTIAAVIVVVLIATYVFVGRWALKRLEAKDVDYLYSGDVKIRKRSPGFVKGKTRAGFGARRGSLTERYEYYISCAEQIENDNRRSTNSGNSTPSPTTWTRRKTNDSEIINKQIAFQYQDFYHAKPPESKRDARQSVESQKGQD